MLLIVPHHVDKNKTLLGYEINKPSKILTKISSLVEYIEFNIQNKKTPRTDDPIIYYVWENILTWFL